MDILQACQRQALLRASYGPHGKHWHGNDTKRLHVTGAEAATNSSSFTSCSKNQADDGDLWSCVGRCMGTIVTARAAGQQLASATGGSGYAMACLKGHT